MSPNDVMTVDQVAAWLRMNRKSIYEAVARKKIPHRRIGRRIVFIRSALIDWLHCRPCKESSE